MLTFPEDPYQPLPTISRGAIACAEGLYDQAFAATHAQIEDQVFTTAWQAGQQLSLEAAISESFAE